MRTPATMSRTRGSPHALTTLSEAPCTYCGASSNNFRAIRLLSAAVRWGLGDGRLLETYKYSASINVLHAVVYLRLRIFGCNSSYISGNVSIQNIRSSTLTLEQTGFEGLQIELFSIQSTFLLITWLSALLRFLCSEAK